MIESWLAKEYTYDKAYKYQKEFKQAEESSKQLKKWIWWLENSEEIIKEIENHNETPSTCNIKWNISSEWEKIYHILWCRSYNITKISLDKWEKYFCTEEEAINEGWRIAGNCN